MEGLNYHHLFYFFTVARLGTIAKASEQLHLTQPTISEQIRLLEKSLGAKLFRKSGRNLALTEAGQKALDYAEKIFALGGELTTSVKGGEVSPKKPQLRIGLISTFCSTLAARLLQPAISGESVVRVYRDRAEALCSRVAGGDLDLVLADEPARRSQHKLFSHKLGQCVLSIFGPEPIARKYKKNFPHSLDGAPLQLPPSGTNAHRKLDVWFETNALTPDLIAEVEDQSLAPLMSSAALFTAPSVVERELTRNYAVKLIGRTGSSLAVFLISRERKLATPAAVAIANSGRGLFR